MTRERVFIFRLGSLGDMVVALPCFHLIERAFPHSERILLTSYPLESKAPAPESILQGAASSTAPFAISSAEPQSRAIGRLARALRRQGGGC